ncbi:MAG: phage tail tube protein [Actinomycetota bacterium]
MAKGHGKDQFLQVEDTGAAILRDLSPFLDNSDFDRQVDMSDSTTVGLEDKTSIPGLSGASIELGGKYDDTAVSGPDVVLGGVIASKVRVAFEYGPLGNTTGKPKYTGECYVERFRISAPLENVVKFTATLRVDGPPTRSTFA